MKKIVWSLLCVVMILSGCNSKDKESDDGYTEVPESEVKELKKLIQFQDSYDAATPVAIMDTSLGTITIVFFPDKAPKAVENFLTHAKDGYYDGITFHRVINNFMIQGGSPDGSGTDGESIWGKAFEDEFSDELFNFRGALSMANAGPNTNGSQFFIVQAPTPTSDTSGYPKLAADKYTEIGGTPSLDGVHTVFGQVIAGMDVVDAIAAVETNNDKPKEDVVIKKITVTTYGEMNK